MEKKKDLILFKMLAGLIMVIDSITKFTQIERKIPKENIFTLSVLVGWASRNFFFLLLVDFGWSG